MAVVRKARTPKAEPAASETLEAAATAVAPNPRAVAGHNRPPIDVEAQASFDEIIDGKDGFRQRMKDLIAAADRAVATNEEEAGRCGELVKQIRAADRFVSEAHTAAKAPYLLAGRVVDAAKTALTGPLATAKSKVEGRQTAFLREEEAKRQAEFRRQREKEEQLRREAYEREQEAARKAAADAPQAAPEPVAPPPPVMVQEPERTVIRGDYGASVSGRKEWVAQVQDYEVAFIAVAENEKVREAIDRAISNMVRGGIRKIDGVLIQEQIKVSNR